MMKKLISSSKMVESFDEAGKSVKLEELSWIDDLKKESKNEFKSKKTIRYSEDFKKAVVMEVLGGLSKDGAKRKYGIGGHTTVLRWFRQYENSPGTDPIRENQPRHLEKSFKYVVSENRRLRKERELSKTKVGGFKEIIDTTEIKTETPIRKLLRQDSYNYSKKIEKNGSFISLRHLSTQVKRFTNKIKEIIDGSS